MSSPMDNEIKTSSLVISYQARLKAFLTDYGERGRKVILAALKRAEELSSSGENSLGDFDYRGVKNILEKDGERINPSTFLSIMEKKYALIETSYKSSKQHWWRFFDYLVVKKELMSSEAGDDSKKIVLAMYASLEPMKILESLEKISIKQRLDYADKLLFKKIAFEDLPKIEEVLKRMVERESEFEREIGVLREIVKLAGEISIKLIRER
jgi:hypothetical protein